MVWVGEAWEEREYGITYNVVEPQKKLALEGLGDYFEKRDKADEPVWAIGTGKSANPEDASKVHTFIKSVLKDLANKDLPTRVLYGGSVNPSNAKEFLTAPDIDGLLVGGASLEPKSFFEIIKSA